ncbi:ankyrin repeat domain-containing protein [Paralysiella testudinis]|nr:ankyrin repeat domain-containing protein [Paralysiella testudinis]
MREETFGEQIVGANWDGNIQFLQDSVDKGLFDPLKITEPEHWNYLHRANLIRPSPERTILFYLEKGVPINAQDCYGMTPLHYAVRSGNYEAVKVLLEAGANPNISNQDGSNPLDLGFELPVNLNLIELLLQHGADIHHEVNGWTVINFIKEYDPNPNKELMQLLEKYA